MIEAEEEESDVDESDEDEAIDKAIAKKFPEFKQCLEILVDLKA